MYHLLISKRQRTKIIGQMGAICTSKQAEYILTHIRMDLAITMHVKYVNQKARIIIMTLPLFIYTNENLSSMEELLYLELYR